MREKINFWTRNTSSAKEFCVSRQRAFMAALSFLLILTMSMTLLSGYGYAETAKQPDDQEESILQQAKQCVAALTTGYVGTEEAWDIVDMASFGQGEKTDRKAFLRKALEIIADDSSSTRSTDLERTAIALTAAGIDITRIAGKDGKTVNLLELMVNDPAELNVNGIIFGLIAVDSGSYEIPAGSKWTRNGYINAILETQHNDGSWNWSTAEAKGDVDMTAMAITALAPYAQDKPAVKTAVEDAFLYIRNKQTGSGDFGSNANTTAMVVLAYLSMGEDPESITFLDQQEKNPMHQLFVKYKTDDGGFGYQDNTKRNELATEQVYRALTTYLRFKESGKPVSPYVFSKPTAGSVEELTGSQNQTAPVIETMLESGSASASDCSFTVTAKDDEDQAPMVLVRWNGSGLTGEKGKYSLTLVSGKNQIEIIAWDSAGNMAKCTYSITYAPASEGGGGGGGILPPAQEKESKVTFSLLGDEVHGQTGGTHTLAGGNLKNWISATSVTIKKGATAGDVFRKVLTEKGYRYEATSGGNYIKSITTPGGSCLAEFSNGQNSGWMYTVNGTHPKVGLNDYVLSDGDTIVWHYTDNYHEEEGSKDWENEETGESKPAEEDDKKDQDSSQNTAWTNLAVKKQAATLTPKVKTVRKSGNEIEAVVLLDQADKEMIREWKESGYRISYRFYRSTKKAASYRHKITKEKNSYLNTKGEKGTRYYYKVQIRICDAKGKLVAETKLKQCRYGCRIF